MSNLIKPGNGLNGLEPQPKQEVKVLHLVSGDTIIANCEDTLDNDNVLVKRPIQMELVPTQDQRMATMAVPWGGILTLGNKDSNGYLMLKTHIIASRAASLEETKVWQQTTSNIALV